VSFLKNIHSISGNLNSAPTGRNLLWNGASARDWRSKHFRWAFFLLETGIRPYRLAPIENCDQLVCGGNAGMVPSNQRQLPATSATCNSGRIA